MSSSLIMNPIQRIMQFGKSCFLFDNRLRHTFTPAQNLDAGEGNNARIKKHTFMLADHLTERRCVVPIKPNAIHDPANDLCGPLAIAVGLAKSLKLSRYRNIHQSSTKEQFGFARHLCKEARVDPGKCGMKETISRSSSIENIRLSCWFWMARWIFKRFMSVPSRKIV